MQLSDLSRIHWIFIGLLGGLATAYMWTGSTDIEGIEAPSQLVFERNLLLHDEKTGLPFIGKIVIHPPEQSPTGLLNVVTYKQLAKDKQGRFGLWLDRRLMAKIPYKPAIAGRVNEDANLTIAQYLSALNQQENVKIDYHYGWWLEPPKAMALGSVGGLLVVGGVWPTALGLISGAGFGPPRSEKKKRKIDWSSFARRSSTGRPDATTDRQPIAAGAGVDEVAQQYERNLTPTGDAKSESSIDDSTDPESIRKLDGGPLEKLPEQMTEAEEVEVKGEYYPVVIRHHKKPE